MKIPSHIKDLQAFGVGDFTDSEIGEKVSTLQCLAEQRSLPDSPEMSVVIPSFREEKRILGTLMSLVQQTSENCEFIIVNNEADAVNPTSEIAEASGFCRVVHEPIKGIAAARQAGLEASEGRVVVSTDADTLHNVDWLESIASKFKDNKTRLSIGRFYFMDQDTTLKTARNIFNVYKALIERRITRRHMPYAGSFGTNSAFLKSVMQDDLGGYDPSLVFGEDTDVLERMIQLNPDMVIPHHDSVFTSARRFNSEGVIAAAGTSIKRRMLGDQFKKDQRSGVYRDYR